MTRSANATFRSRKMVFGIQLPVAGPVASTDVREKTIASFRRRLRQIHQTGSSNNTQSASGV